MATVTKDFKVKNGLVVEGTTGTIDGHDILTKKTDDQNYIIGLIGGAATSANEADTVVLRDENGSFSAEVITADGGFVGNVTGTVSDISNHDTGDLSEGSNLYFTNQRALDATSAAYDAAGSAADALDDANAYTDSALESYTPTANLDTTIDGYGYLKSDDISGKQDTLTAGSNIDISSNVISVTGLTSSEISDFNSAALSATSSAYDASGSAATAEQNAKDYADDLINDVSNSSTEVWSAYKTSTEIGLAQSAAESYADTAIANLVDSAPATLDTLNELAAALQDNPDIITDLQDIAAGKQDTLTAGNGIVIDNDLIYVPTSIGSGISVTPSTVEIDRAVVDTWYDAAGAASSAQTAAESFATTAANNAQSAAEDYADGLAVNYDAAGSASAAQSAAQSYADGLAINYDAAGSASTAQTNANTYTDNSINALDTDDIEEGVNNLYFTDGRAKDSAAALLTNATLTNIQITGTGNGGLTITAENGVADSDTDDLVEGSTNLYFTDQRAVDALEAVVPNFEAVEIDSLAKQVAATVSVPTASTVTAFSWAAADYRTAKFLVKTAYGTHTDVSEVLLTLDTSDNVAITEYAMVGTNGSAMTVSADVSGSDVRLRIATVNNNSTVTVVGTLLA